VRQLEPFPRPRRRYSCFQLLDQRQKAGRMNSVFPLCARVYDNGQTSAGRTNEQVFRLTSRGVEHCPPTGP